MKAPSIAIVGSCQVAGLGVALRRILPNSDIGAWHLGVHPESDIEAALSNVDLVVSQIGDSEGGTFCPSRLRESFPAVIYLPIVAFRGFQPDCVYLNTPAGLIKDGLGDMHSAIISAAFVLGIPAVRVPKLFNSLVFSALGYFDAFATAKTQLLKTFSEAGYDLNLFINQWIRKNGAFMYTVNHPKIRVLADLSRMVAQRADLIGQQVPPLDGLDDPLARSIQWPVYPELARRIGIVGSTTFVRSLHKTEPGACRDLLLHAFVAHCYDRYSSIPREVIRAAISLPILEKIETTVRI